jgi:hypothetical protein
VKEYGTWTVSSASGATQNVLIDAAIDFTIEMSVI